MSQVAAASVDFKFSFMVPSAMATASSNPDKDPANWFSTNYVEGPAMIKKIMAGKWTLFDPAKQKPIELQYDADASLDLFVPNGASFVTHEADVLCSGYRM